MRAMLTTGCSAQTSEGVNSGVDNHSSPCFFCRKKQKNIVVRALASARISHKVRGCFQGHRDERRSLFHFSMSMPVTTKRKRCSWRKVLSSSTHDFHPKMSFSPQESTINSARHQSSLHLFFQSFCISFLFHTIYRCTNFVKVDIMV